jgi:hypothetical protein
LVYAQVKWKGYPDNESTWEPEWSIPIVFKNSYDFGIPIPDASADEASEAEAEDDDTDLQDTIIPGAVLFQCSYPKCFLLESFPSEFSACMGCGASTTPAKCTGVSTDWARYCTSQCQELDWARHCRKCGKKATPASG